MICFGATTSNVEIRDARDASVLTLEMLQKTAEESIFRCKLDKGVFQGSIETSTYVVGPPSGLFAEMARDWRGWTIAKTWRDLDMALSLNATTDRTGHVTLHIEMRSNPPEGTSLESRLMLEAGSLNKIAVEVAQLFRDDRSLEFVKGLVETEK